jgi:RNA polymerase sigma-70 factor (ECF subfamily)
LLIRIRDPRDEEAWRTFVATYAPLIRSYARRCGLQGADAADVTQEALARVARAMRTFEYQPELGRFRDWLRTLTRNVIARFVTDRKGPKGEGEWPHSEIERAAVSEADSAWTAEFHARVLRAALSRVRLLFEDSTWRAFERTWIDDVAAPKVARELGVQVDTVYVSKSRVLKRLREEVLVLAEDLPQLSSLK